MTREIFGFVAAILLATSAQGSDLVMGTPDIKSAGPLAFGPDGILFVGDPVGGAIFAIDTGDVTPDRIGPKFYATDFDKMIVAAVGDEPRFYGRFNDLAINPASGRAYLSFHRGTVREAIPAIVRVGSAGKVEPVPLRDIRFAKLTLPNPAPVDARRPGPNDRGLSVTDLAFVDGRLYVAGLSGEKFASMITTISYPFPDKVEEGTIVEIFRGGWGEYDATQPIYSFEPCRLKGELHFLAVYTQTPLVKIPFSALRPGAKIRAVTIAELGNRNNPLDMLAYRGDGKDWVIITNTRQGLMKISLDWLASAPAIETRLVGPAGLAYEKIALLGGLSQLARIDDDHALVLGHKSMGGNDLFAIPLP